MSPVRRRPVFAISGWLMVVLLFLPTLRVCSDPTAPIEFPPAYFVYVGCIVAAFGAWSTSRRARHVAVVVIAAVWILALDLIGVGFLSGGNATIGTIAALSLLAVTVAVVRLLALAKTGERTFSGAMLAQAMIATGWYVLLAGDPDAMYGAYVGLVVTGAMLLSAIGAVVGEGAARAAVRRAARPAPLPVARVIT